MKTNDGIQKVFEMLEKQQKVLEFLKQEQLVNQKRFAEIDKRFMEAKTENDKKHAVLVKKMEEVEERMALLEMRIKRLEVRTADMEIQVEDTEKSARRIEIAVFDQDIVQLNKRTERIEAHVNLPGFDPN